MTHLFNPALGFLDLWERLAYILSLQKFLNHPLIQIILTTLFIYILKVVGRKPVDVDILDLLLKMNDRFGEGINLNTQSVRMFQSFDNQPGLIFKVRLYTSQLIIFLIRI